MLRSIVKYFEESIESIFFPKKTKKILNPTDPHEYLKSYELDVIKGIGPKTKIKLVNNGIKNAYDLINCQYVEGFSQNKIENWKNCALSLQ